MCHDKFLLTTLDDLSWLLIWLAYDFPWILSYITECNCLCVLCVFCLSKITLLSHWSKQLTVCWIIINRWQLLLSFDRRQCNNNFCSSWLTFLGFWFTTIFFENTTSGTLHHVFWHKLAGRCLLSSSTGLRLKKKSCNTFKRTNSDRKLYLCGEGSFKEEILNSHKTSGLNQTTADTWVKSLSRVLTQTENHTSSPKVLTNTFVQDYCSANMYLLILFNHARH